MADFNIGGSWDFNNLSSSGLANLITPNAIYFDSGTGQFTYGASGGAAFDPASSYSTSGDWTNSGNWSFQGGFDVNIVNPLSMQCSGGGNNFFMESVDANVTIQALAAGQQVQIYGDGFNFSSQQTANFNSVLQNVNVNANAGDLNLSGLNANLSSTNSMNIFTTAGGMNINTSTGDLNITAGVGPTSGNLNLNTQQGTFNLNASAGGGSIGTDTDLNLNSNTGSVSLNTSNANISAGPMGIGMGVSAGSGMSVDAVTGNFSFGASTGSFLLGALANTVDITSGTTMTLTGGVKIDVASANVTLSLITDEAPVVAAPTISLPVGFKYVIIDDASGQLYKMG